METAAIFLILISLVYSTNYDMLPIANDCTSYKMLINGVIDISSCSSGLHFSPTQLVCLPPENAKCERQYWCKDSTVEIIPDPVDCKAYHECSTGRPIKNICSLDLWWDFEDSRCTNNFSVKCDSRATITPSNPEHYSNAFSTTTFRTVTVSSKLKASSTTLRTTSLKSISTTPARTAKMIAHSIPNLDSCKYKKDLFDGSSYLKSVCIIDKVLTYDAAMQKCSENNMNLFIVENETVETQFYDAVMFLLKLQPVGSVWINGKLDGISWNVFSTDGSVKGQLYDKIRWYSKYVNGDCLKFSGQQTRIYQAMPANCNDKIWYACEHFMKTEGPPALDTNVCTFKKNFYKDTSYLKSMCVIKSADNYDEGRQRCARHGMNLFIFDSKEVEEAFHQPDVELIKKHPRSTVWVNGMRDPNSNEWTVYHSNRTSIGPLNEEIEWVNHGATRGRTNGDCLRYSGQFGPYQVMGFNCNVKTWIVCEYYI